MRVLTKMINKFSAFSLLLLCACSFNRHPKMLSFTPASVVVDFNGSDLHGATQLAQQFCSSINKDAQYVRSEESFWGGDRKGFFNCVTSSTHGANSNSGHKTTPIINNFK